jgi:hypothetical protein
MLSKIRKAARFGAALGFTFCYVRETQGACYSSLEPFNTANPVSRPGELLRSPLKPVGIALRRVRALRLDETGSRTKSSCELRGIAGRSRSDAFFSEVRAFRVILIRPQSFASFKDSTGIGGTVDYEDRKTKQGRPKNYVVDQLRIKDCQKKGSGPGITRPLLG